MWRSGGVGTGTGTGTTTTMTNRYLPADEVERYDREAALGEQLTPLHRRRGRHRDDHGEHARARRDRHGHALAAALAAAQKLRQNYL